MKIALLAILVLLLFGAPILHLWGRRVSEGRRVRSDGQPEPTGSGQQGSDGEGSGNRVGWKLAKFAAVLALIMGCLWWAGVFDSGLTFDRWNKRNLGWQEVSDIKSGRYVLEATGKNIVRVAHPESGTTYVEVLPDGTRPDLGRTGIYPEPWNLPVPGGPPLGLILKVGRDGQPFSYAKGVQVFIPGGKKLWASLNVPQDRYANFCLIKGKTHITVKKI